MKASIKLFSIAVIIFLFTGSNSFSTPLSGTYTIGSGGNYPTIISAYVDLFYQGLSGPVIFDVISGIYNEDLTISGVSGYSSTLKSQSGNPSDVIINSINISYANNIFITDLSLRSDVHVLGNNINFNNNDFQNHSFSIDLDAYSDSFQDIYIIGNKNIEDIIIAGDEFGGGISGVYNSQIKNNNINGSLYFHLSNSVLIENNIIGGDIHAYRASGEIIKNKIRGSVINIYGYFNIYNNFIYGNFRSDGNTIIRNNTISGGSLSTSTVDCVSSFLFNNIIINPEGGLAFSGSNVYSDFNDFYNGGNSDLINYNGVSYNNVSDFYNATGLDQNSNSHPVTFQSPTDMHLSGISIGDMQLAGIPNILVPDDIDGQIRSSIHPYKGADEADFPLPAELSSFTSSVNNNNVQLYWTTASETNNSGFDVERSIVNGEWSKVNFIKGHGNSTTPQNYSFTDKNLSSGKYKYRLKQIDFNGNFEYHNLSNEVVIGVPEKISLSQNYPNPFNPTTKINYELRVTNYVSLKVYDLSGKEVKSLVSENQNAGSYEVEFDGSNLASGAYFYKIQAGDFTAVKKMLLIK